MPRWIPGESRQRPGDAPVSRNSAALTGAIPAADPTKLRQRPGLIAVVAGNAQADPGECRWRPGKAQVYRCIVALPEVYRYSPGLHLGTTGDNRGVAVALPGFIWAPVQLRFRPGCSRLRPGCFRCRAGRCRSFTVTPGSPRRY
ncbi:hypothetical protein DPMN_095140 [Dreissena polymorpha]|uniref:Uncharacterized protein n=1 Tax=Dreissena polymorpha TaxID=45954 RepID=A0A9D4L8S1_DREPO|nr:hypothetical protein DPMN_095140 [Dreissena polymorpha]